MLNGRNIVCVSVPEWKGEYAATIIELMKVFGRHNKVLYVQNPYTVKDLATALVKRKKFPLGKVLGFSSRITEYPSDENGMVYVMVPPLTLSINFLPQGGLYNALLRVNGWLVRRSIRRNLKRLKMREKLVNITAFNPMMGVVTGRQLGEETLIYHCYDEIKEATWMKKHGPSQERQFIQMSDAVVVTSRGLLEKKKVYTDQCYLIKNAADIKLFNTGFVADAPAKRTVGFIGSLDNRVDYNLLVHLIESMPAVNFLLVGRIVDKKGEAMLRAYPNVSLPGARSVQELPAYLKEFSVGIIPFVKNEFTSGIYPLKINEYLAAGLPVVSTDFSYLDDFADVISIAENHEKFKQSLVAEMESDTLQKKLLRQKAASENSWENRVEELSALITDLEKKSGKV
jgi:glycosyltransferase involved in cell wall biosynthesis